mgnify:CR=1 FL=1
MASTALTLALSPEQGLQRYLSEIRKFPMLTKEDEFMLAKRWQEHGDSQSAHKLVTSHLRLVAKIAMGYRGYGLPVAELISEGNVGMMQAVEASGTPCIVRAPWNDPIWIKRVLDAGVESLMIPQIETAAAARAAVAACRYPPQGTRGYAAGVVRASTFGLEPGYVQKANANLLLVLQIESAAAVEQAAEICAVEGVDVVFIGVNDLAGSIGRLEQLDHPDVRSLVRRVEDVILASGKPMGTVPSAGASWQELFARGYRLVVGPHDIVMLRDIEFNLFEVFGAQQIGFLVARVAPTQRF